MGCFSTSTAAQRITSPEPKEQTPRIGHCRPLLDVVTGRVPLSRNALYCSHNSPWPNHITLDVLLLLLPVPLLLNNTLTT